MKKTILKTGLLVLMLSFFVVTPILTVQANGQPQGGEFPNPLTASSFTDLVVDIAEGIYRFIIPAVAVLMLIIAGLLFMLSGGNPEKISRAKKFFIWALVGIAIVIAGEALVYLIQDILGVSTN